jgi:hypothetical protein
MIKRDCPDDQIDAMECHRDEQGRSLDAGQAGEIKSPYTVVSPAYKTGTSTSRRRTAGRRFIGRKLSFGYGE